MSSIEVKSIENGLKREYYDYLDKNAENVAKMLSEGKKITELLLRHIAELYSSENSIKKYFDENNKFKMSYHPPISSDLEFLIARVLYHYSKYKHLNWDIYLRCQERKTAPDIRIEKNGQTIAIIEVKANIGWIQPFFSTHIIDNAKDDSKRKDCKERIKKQKKQLTKYSDAWEIKPEQVFVFLPSLQQAHRKKNPSKLEVEDYYVQFSENSGLPQENMILLSNNLNLNLSSGSNEYDPTNGFEMFIVKLS